MKYYTLFILTIILMISGCATPPEVKQLSLKQLDYLNVLTDAVTVQSEGLIAMAENLKNKAGENISCHQKNSIDRLNILMSNTIDTTDLEKRREIKQKILAQAKAINQVSDHSRQKLSSDYQAIKHKTEQLSTYLKKIKEVHKVLNGYIQSQKIGEQLLSSSVGHKSIDGFIGTMNTYIPLIRATSRDLGRLLNAAPKQ